MAGARYPLLHAFAYDAGTLQEWQPSRIADARERLAPGRVVWVNVNDNRDPETLRSLERDFGVHPLTIEDIQNARQRPKVEEYPGYAYVVVQMLKQDDDGELDTEQVSILLGDGWVVTVQEGKPGDVFEPLRERLRSGRPQVRAAGADYLLYSILDALVDAYFPVIERVTERAEDLEEEIVADEVEEPQHTLMALLRDVRTLRRVVYPQRDALATLERGDTRWIAAGTRTFLRDVRDHAQRVADQADTIRDLVASLMDLHRANLALRSNETMKVLTLVATVFIPLTFIAGVYGMNFEHMPELEWRYGYPAVLLAMVLVGAALLALFRRRGLV